MGLMPFSDSLFFWPENREQPMHVGELQVFDLPEGAGSDLVPQLYERILSSTTVSPSFRRRAHRSLRSAGRWTWVTDDALDLTRHVHLCALPEPGGAVELRDLVLRLHGDPPDRRRPLWEIHVIDGLAASQFAVYVKFHHAMMDGVSLMQLIERSMGRAPEDPSEPMWGFSPTAPRRQVSLGIRLRGVGAAARDAATMAPRLIRLVRDARGEPAAALPLQAPTCLLNVSITGRRQHAMRSWPHERIKSVSRAAGCTFNDVVLAMCAQSLREHLLAHDDLPDSPLVALTPVSLHAEQDQGPRNAISTILCGLATTESDPRLRLHQIHASMAHGKQALRRLSAGQMSTLGVGLRSPMLLNGAIGMHKLPRQTFNVMISTVPGPEGPRYWHGARLQALYPLSLIAHGQALNISALSCGTDLNVGLTACRRALPDLDPLLDGLERGLADLERTYEIAPVVQAAG